MPFTQLQINHPNDVKLFQQLIADYCQSWSTLPNQNHPNWENVFNLYAPVEGLMFYDAVTPESFSNQRK